MVKYIFISRGSGSGVWGAVAKNILFEVTIGEDAPPRSACTITPLPHAAGKADRAEQEAKERKNKRQPCRTCKPWFALTGLYSWHCIGITWLCN